MVQDLVYLCVYDMYTPYGRENLSLSWPFWVTETRLQNHRSIQWWCQGSRRGVQSLSLTLGASEELWGLQDLGCKLASKALMYFGQGWGYFGSDSWTSKLEDCLISCSLQMFFAGSKPHRKEAAAGWLFGRTGPIAQLVVSRQKARAETIWRAHFPPFPPALLYLKQLVWFHMYYFPCQKMTPTRNRIREVGKGRENVIIGQNSIPSPRTLGFSCHFWCLLSISDICLACSFSSDDIFFYSSVVALVYRFGMLMY